MDGLAWSSMAILVRSAIRQAPVLQRALAAAGIPVTVVGDGLPLAAEPGARPLLTLLDCALRPGALDEEAAAELLTGPLGGTDALGLRRLRRALRAAALAAGELPAEEPLAAALRDPRELLLIGGPPRAGGNVRRQAAAGPRRWSPAPWPRRGGWRGCWRSRDRPPGRGRGRRRRDGARCALGGMERLRAGGVLAAGQRRGRQPRRGRRRRPGRGGRACSTRPPGSPRGTRRARRGCSWTAWPGRRSSATRWPSAPRAAPGSPSLPRTGPRGWSGTWSWWPGFRRAPGPMSGPGDRCCPWTSSWRRPRAPHPAAGWARPACRTPPMPPPPRSPPSCSTRSAGSSTSR